MNKLIISKRALKEISKSCEWFDNQQDQLSVKFRQDLNKKLKLLTAHPKRSVMRVNSFYEMQLEVFPFPIVYKFDEVAKEIFVSSVFHTSRNANGKYK